MGESAELHTFADNRYDQMIYRRCGRSGLALPAVSLGAWLTFGGYRGEEVAKEAFFRAFDLGITHFDLANMYGDPRGNAELITGRIIKHMPRNELIISSKAGYYMWPGPYGSYLSKKHIAASIDDSLKRLGLDYVDIFYAHRPDPHTPLEETMEALDLIVRQGKALYVGVSNFSGVHFENAVRVASSRSLAPITIHQPRYNMLDREIEWDLVDHAERCGTGIIPYSPLASGLLTDKYLDGEVPEDSRATHIWGDEHTKSRLSDHVLGQLRALNDIAAARGQTLSQMALAWILRLPAVTSVLIGASNVKQIEQNVEALQNLEFSEEELAAIDEITLPRAPGV